MHIHVIPTLPMSRTAVFLGAGASKAFGFPLTSDLFPNIRADLRCGTAFGRGTKARDKNARLHAFLEAMLPGYAAAGTLPLITDVLSLVDHAVLGATVPLGRAFAGGMREFRALLEEAIYHQLDWPYGEDSVPPVLDRFARWIHRRSQASDDAVAVISTNYDVSVDDMLFWLRRNSLKRIRAEIDMGLTWRDVDSGEVYTRPAKPKLRLYKLHGSLNWLRCDMCEHVYVNPDGPIAHLAFSGQTGDHNTCHCENTPLRPMMVAPSFVRDVRDVNLLEVWKSTLEYLRRADEWIIIGYSFPPEDLAIRSLFIRAYHGRERKPGIRVIQKDVGMELTSRYRLFFPDCVVEGGGLEAFVDTLDTTRRRAARKGVAAAATR